MDMGLFEKIVREYDEIGGGELELTPAMGDPLMDTKILERIHLARSYDKIGPVWMYTNGILLDKVGVKNFLDSGIGRMHISIAGHNREAYKRLMGVDAFDRVKANVLELLELNNGNGRKVEIRIDVRADVSMSKVVKEKPFQEFRKLTNLIDYQIFYHDWVGMVPGQEIPEGMMRERMRWRRGPCAKLYCGPKILWNGDVSACCTNPEGNPGLILGNVRDFHLLQLWQGEAMGEVRRSFVGGEPPEPCHKCTRYIRFSFNTDLHYRRRVKEKHQDFLDSDYFRRVNGGGSVSLPGDGCGQSCRR